MRFLLASLLAVASLGVFARTPVAEAQTCTGLCLQQVPSCPNGGTTSISGTVYAPNGIDPLPNVLVYVPNAPVDPFAPGVSCPAVGQPPSGSPLVGTTTAVDGTFTIANAPVGANIPLVIQTGRWRRQVVIPTVSACANTPVLDAKMPKNQTQGDIPKIAISTGSADQVECVLRKVGIDDSEFTDPGGTGRINLYSGAHSPGALIDAATPSETTLMGNAPSLNSYDVLMLPCEGNAFAEPADELTNLVGFANAGGRVYASHYSYTWMYQNAPFNTVANWTGRNANLPDGIANVDQTFSEGITLAQWLQLTGASTTLGQIPISTLRQNFNGVVAPTQSYLALIDAAANNPVMQFVFDAPVNQIGGQCGRVLFNEYHVETTNANASQGVSFPAECPQTTAMSPQEKLLEFSLFELTSDGSAATLTPATQDFGTQPIGFNSPAQTFTWTNNSSFAASVSLLNASGDFAVTGNNCTGVKAGASCQIQVVFNPTVIGARTGTLTVGSGPTTLTSALTGTGIPALSFSLAQLNFGNQDVGFIATQTVTVANVATGPVTLPSILITGDYSVTSTCGSTLARGATCTLNVSFTPGAIGPRPGTMTVGTNVPTVLTGNGVDFTIGLTPTTGDVIAGYAVQTESLMTPLAGFNANLKISCTTSAPGTTCLPDNTSVTPIAALQDLVKITTTSKYTVIGYGGAGRFGLVWLLALASGALLLLTRRRTGPALRTALLLALLAFASLSVTGCSGKIPAQNPIFTGPGSYTFTVTATDGFLVHSATYSLSVQAK